MASGNSESSNCVNARVVLQQCISAKLMVKPPTDNEEAEYVQINRGLIIYICFLKGATETMLEKMVKSVLLAKLSETEEGKYVGILELPGDILIIPQSTLGGTLKGKVMQYHRNISKGEGLRLYNKFIELCREMMDNSEQCKRGGSVLKHGTYGNRQVSQFDTSNGPYTHLMEF